MIFNKKSHTVCLSDCCSLFVVVTEFPFFPFSDLFEALSELIILTASSCLHGKEIRGMLNERVAQLYADLDGGFSHAAWLLPGWLPLPSFRYKETRATAQENRPNVHIQYKRCYFFFSLWLGKGTELT